MIYALLLSKIDNVDISNVICTERKQIYTCIDREWSELTDGMLPRDITENDVKTVKRRINI